MDAVVATLVRIVFSSCGLTCSDVLMSSLFASISTAVGCDVSKSMVAANGAIESALGSGITFASIFTALRFVKSIAFGGISGCVVVLLRRNLIACVLSLDLSSPGVGDCSRSSGECLLELLFVVVFCEYDLDVLCLLCSECLACASYVVFSLRRSYINNERLEKK